MMRRPFRGPRFNVPRGWGGRGNFNRGGFNQFAANQPGPPVEEDDFGGDFSEDMQPTGPPTPHFPPQNAGIGRGGGGWPPHPHPPPFQPGEVMAWLDHQHPVILNRQELIHSVDPHTFNYPLFSHISSIHTFQNREKENHFSSEMIATEGLIEWIS